MTIDEKTFARMPPHLRALFVKLPNLGSEDVLAGFPQAGNNWKRNYGEEDYKGRQYKGGVFAGGGYFGNSTYADSGSAARFFYCAKASRSEREAGLSSLQVSGALDTFRTRTRTAQCNVCGNKTKAAGPNCGHDDWKWVEQDTAARTPMAGRGQGGLKCAVCGKWKVSGSPCTCAEPQFEPSAFERPELRNAHPTVKPLALMRYLVRLVTPPDGLVLDPFLGSGTTGVACQAEGFRFIGIEQDQHYCDIAAARMAAGNVESDLSRNAESDLPRNAESDRPRGFASPRASAPHGAQLGLLWGDDDDGNDGSTRRRDV